MLLTLTHHPFQRAGAHAAARLAGRDHPHEVTASDLDDIAEQIVSACYIAAHAPRGGPGWAWQQLLAPMWPNGPATHPKRAAAKIPVRDRMRELLAEDRRDAETWPCWTCSRPTSERWGKQLWPLQDAAAYINNSADDEGGRPTCRACRICLGSLPWGIGYMWGLCVTMDGPEAAEQAFARRCADVASTVLAQRSADWSQTPHPMDIALEVVLDHPDQIELSFWTNSNRAPELTRMTVDAAPAQWLADAIQHGHGALIRQLATRVRKSELWLAAHPNRATNAMLAMALDETTDAAARGQLATLAADLCHTMDIDPTDVTETGRRYGRLIGNLNALRATARDQTSRRTSLLDQATRCATLHPSQRPEHDGPLLPPEVFVTLCNPADYHDPAQWMLGDLLHITAAATLSEHGAKMKVPA